jgi:hypothetical protein
MNRSVRSKLIAVVGTSVIVQNLEIPENDKSKRIHRRLERYIHFGDALTHTYVSTYSDSDDEPECEKQIDWSSLDSEMYELGHLPLRFSFAGLYQAFYPRDERLAKSVVIGFRNGYGTMEDQNVCIFPICGVFVWTYRSQVFRDLTLRFIVRVRIGRDVCMS